MPYFCHTPVYLWLITFMLSGDNAPNSDQIKNSVCVNVTNVVYKQSKKQSYVMASTLNMKLSLLIIASFPTAKLSPTVGVGVFQEEGRLVLGGTVGLDGVLSPQRRLPGSAAW